MPYSTLTHEQIQIIYKYVLGQDVVDLGAGSLIYSNMILELGGDSVTALDCIPMPPHSNISIIQQSFSEYHAQHDIAYLSWPINKFSAGLNEILAKHETIIYVGSNIGGTLCGHSSLFEYLITREPIEYHFDHINTLIVYSNMKRTLPLYSEEFAGIDAWIGGGIMTIPQAEAFDLSLNMI
jgi:hypothetical protein